MAPNDFFNGLLGEENEDLSSGETDVFVSALATDEIGDVRLALVHELGLLGDPSGPGVDALHALSLGAALPVTTRAAAFATLAGESLPEEDTELASATIGVGTSLTADAILDFAVRLGLDDDAPDAEYLMGVTLAF
ncbi:MAG: hypothetical protein GY711_05070 [bacterium]|nr:hypothetical protein [bacterium]